MARMAPTVFCRYRFLLCTFHRKEWFGASVVFNDPFDESLWIGVAHKLNEKTIMQLLVEETCIEVWLGAPHHGRGPARRMRVTFPGDSAVKWLPLDLNAASSEVAMEYVRITPICQESPEDVPFDECPLKVKRLMDPRYEEETND